MFILRMKLSLNLACRAGIAAVVAGLALRHLSGIAVAQIEPNSPPNITLTNPPSGGVYSFVATIRLKAAATDVDGSIVEVRFYEGTNLLGTVTQPPFNLNVTEQDELHDLAYCYYAIAMDDRGATATSGPVRVIISQDPIPPNVALIQPGDGEAFLLPATTTLTAVVHAWDGSENPVQFFSGTNLIGCTETPLHSIPVTNRPPQFPPYTATYYSATVTNLSIGEHTLTARYVDNLGNGGTSQEVHIKLTPLFLGKPILGNGQFHFTIGGLSTGMVFQVEASSNLVVWSSIATNTATSNLFEFIDSVATNQCRRFYRVKQNL